MPTVLGICPVCGSALTVDSAYYSLQGFFWHYECNWNNDPIKTPLGLAGTLHRGSTKVHNTHLYQLQYKRSLVEDDLVLYRYMLPEDKTVFTSGAYTWEEGLPGHMWVKRRAPRKTHIQELRTSTELCLLHNEISKEDYFNYDYRGFPLTRPHQTDWTDLDLANPRKKVRAIHIEELRKPNPMSLIEDWRNCAKTPFVYNKHVVGTGEAGQQSFDYGSEIVDCVGSNLFYPYYPRPVIHSFVTLFSASPTSYGEVALTYNLTPSGFIAHVYLRAHADEMMYCTGYIPGYGYIWTPGLIGGGTLVWLSGGFLSESGGAATLKIILPEITIKNNSILSFDAVISGSWFNTEDGTSGAYSPMTFTFAGLTLVAGTHNLGVLLGADYRPGYPYGDRDIKSTSLVDKELILNPSWALRNTPPEDPIHYVADAESTFDISITNIKIINVRKGWSEVYHN